MRYAAPAQAVAENTLHAGKRGCDDAAAWVQSAGNGPTSPSASTLGRIGSDLWLSRCRELIGATEAAPLQAPGSRTPSEIAPN